MAESYRNRNWGYQQLRVWRDAVELYRMVCRVFRPWPYELKRVGSQQIACTDSVHRNIAEGYCRRSIREYIQHLYIALGSLGEAVSSLANYKAAEQLTAQEFTSLDGLAFKLENGLLRLVESLGVKRERGDWIDHLMVKECNTAYGMAEGPASRITPSLHRSITPVPRHSSSPFSALHRSATSGGLS